MVRMMDQILPPRAQQAHNAQERYEERGHSQLEPPIVLDCRDSEQHLRKANHKAQERAEDVGCPKSGWIDKQVAEFHRHERERRLHEIKYHECPHVLQCPATK
eukprot:1084915-Prymnesium_polylepis.2